VAERSAAAGTGEAGAAGLANFVAGATASLVTQSVIVPVRARPARTGPSGLLAG